MSRQSLDASQPPHQGGEARPSGRVAVGVDVLPEQRDLDHAPVNQRAGLRLDPRGRPRYLGAAGVGHDAEGAELVAAFLHGEEGRGRPPGAAVRRAGDRTCPRWETRSRPAVRRARGGRACPAGGGRPADRPPGRPRARVPGSRHPPPARRSRRRRSAASGFAIFRRPQPPELGVDLLGGLLADMAGVEQDQVGVFGGRHGLVAARYRARPPFARCHRRSSDSRRSSRRASCCLARRHHRCHLAPRSLAVRLNATRSLRLPRPCPQSCPYVVHAPCMRCACIVLTSRAIYLGRGLRPSPIFFASSCRLAA